MRKLKLSMGLLAIVFATLTVVSCKDSKKEHDNEDGHHSEMSSEGNQMEMNNESEEHHHAEGNDEHAHDKAPKQDKSMEAFQKTKMMQQGGDKKKTHRRKSLSGK